MNLGSTRGNADQVLALLAEQRRPLAGRVREPGALVLAPANVCPDMAWAAGDEPGGRCALCALRTSGSSDALSGSATLAYRDEDLMALAVNGHRGILLVPCRHVGNLSTLRAASSTILAGLRRAGRAVEVAYEVAGATVEPTTDVAGSPGHLAYWVVPTPRREPGPPVTGDHDPTLLRAIAEHLRPLPPPEGWRISGSRERGLRAGVGIEPPPR